MRLSFKIISIILHPVFIPLYLLFIIFSLPVLSIQALNPLMKVVIAGLLAINNIIIPIFSFYILKNLSFTKSLQMETAAERKAPYLLGFVYYIITALIFFRTSYIDELISFIPASVAATILVLFFINNYIKISAHMASMGGALAFFIILHFYFDINTFFLVIGTTIISGLVATARLYLKAHTEIEVYSGFIVGFVLTLFAGYAFLF